MATVKLKNVSKTYDGKIKIVNNIDFEVSDNEFVVLVGPSGCGKSSILRMIAGLEEITEGQIYIDGNLVNKIPPKDRNIAMVFQNYALYPHLSVYDNLAFGLKLRRVARSEIEEMIYNAAKILNIEHLLNRKPKQLSGGERQRVALGRAIVRKPKVFLFDEPLSNLDAALRVHMRSEILQLHQKIETTVIYVTHDQTEAMTMGNRIIVLRDGMIQQVDTPLNIYNNPANIFVAGFIGIMNFINGKIIQGNGLKFISNQSTFSFTLDKLQSEKLCSYINKDITIGIRPESFLVDDKEKPAIKVKLDFVEHLGSETNLHFLLDESPCIAKVKLGHNFRSGADIYLCYDIQKFHFFDETKGARILCES